MRKGNAIQRRRALLVGGSIVVAVSAATSVAVLKHAGIIDWPYIVTPSFMVIVIAIGYEMTTDMLQTAELAARLHASHAELVLTEQRLQMSAQAAGVGIWEWNMTSDEVRLSELALRIFGLPSSETVTAATLFDRLKPDDRKAVRSAAELAAANGEEFDVWARIRSSDHRQRWVALRGRVSCAGSGQPLMVRGVAMDVTERQEADQRVRAIAESSPIGVLMVNQGGVIVFANRKVEAIFGYDQGELQGKPVDRLVPEAMQQQYGERKNAFSNGTYTMLEGRDVLGLRKDGDTRVVEVWLSAARIHDERVTVVSVIDNSWRREAEIELNRRRDELAHLSRVAMLGELSGSLAHELNQPLTAILSNAQASQQLAAQGRLTPEVLKDILQDIVEDTRRAGEVIRRLRILLRRGEVLFERLELNTIMLEVLRLLSSELIDRRVAVDTSLSPGLPQVLGDRVQLQQVVLNLILNACEAMETQPPPRRLLVSTSADAGDRVRLSVTDQGPGIQVEKLDDVFEPFFTTKTQGLGLGLSVCRTIIEHHRGLIGAANNPVRGATFYFSLQSAPKEA